MPHITIYWCSNHCDLGSLGVPPWQSRSSSPQYAMSVMCSSCASHLLSICFCCSLFHCPCATLIFWKTNQPYTAQWHPVPLRTNSDSHRLWSCPLVPPALQLYLRLLDLALSALAVCPFCSLNGQVTLGPVLSIFAVKISAYVSWQAFPDTHFTQGHIALVYFFQNALLPVITFLFSTFYLFPCI
jgi:hypothetical protein